MLFIFQGPSGSGKTTQADKLANHKQFKKITTATTRPPRPGEVDGKDYYFLSEDAYAEQLAAGELSAPTDFHGARYGIPKRELEAVLADPERHAVAVLDEKGARELKSLGAVVICFKLPEDERHARLKRRRDHSRFEEEPDNDCCDAVLDSQGDEEVVYRRLLETLERYIPI